MSNMLFQLNKEVVNIEILHLDDVGYGPKGQHTRRQWREACLSSLLAEKGTFTTWYNYETKMCREDLPCAKHGYVNTYSDGSSETFFDEGRQLAYAVDFVGHKFDDGFDVSWIQFSRLVLFGGAWFRGYADFTETRFGGNVDFDNVAFDGQVSFLRTGFAENANFASAIFFGNTEFNGAFFGKQADFTDATFVSDVDFSNARFGGDTFFRSVRFNTDAFFTKTSFHSLCHFQNRQDVLPGPWGRETSFENQADFENAEFENVGHFERVRFVSLVPSFLGVDNATTRLEFSDDSYFAKQDRTEDAVTRLGHLKRLADEHGQTDQALNFNALELHAKAGLATTGGFTKFVTRVYGAASDYGRSFARPIYIYAAMLIATFLLAAGHATFSLPSKDCYGVRWQVLSDLRRTTAPCSLATDDKLHLSGYRAAFEYMLYRAAGVLDFSDNGKATDAVARRLFGQPIEPWWMRFWGVIKAIASTALLFLTALGLRNKYRIK